MSTETKICIIYDNYKVRTALVISNYDENFDQVAAKIAETYWDIVASIGWPLKPKFVDYSIERLKNHGYECATAPWVCIEDASPVTKVTDEEAVKITTVKQGRWIANRICSICRKEISEWAAQNGYRYCPNCGAKMYD